MTNRRYDPVSYRPFRTEPLLADGLLAVARPGGDLLERVSEGMFRLAAEAGQVADRKAERQGAMAGQQAALAGRPNAAYPEQAAGAGGVTVAGGDHHAIAASIVRKEEGFRENPYWDVNAYRTGYGSDTITRADGSVVKVAKGMTVSRADAERDLSRRLGEFERTAAGQTGAENWSRLPAATRGALLSVTYNYGSLPKAVVAAVRSGDPNAIAGAVGNLSANKTRRQREASIIRGGATGPAPAGVDATATAGVPGGPAASGAAPELTVSGGTFRPTGRDTVYGRAFDKAGSETYVQFVETEMRSTTSQLFDRYKDDPVGLTKAFNDLRGALKKDHIFPEIEADFEVGFGRLAGTYVDQARKNLSDKIKKQDLADFFERGSALATDREKRLADFDADSPGAADALASALQASDAHFDDAVDRGIIDADDAARAKIAARNQTASGFYLKQAAGLDADGVAAMRAEMAGSGGAEGLDGDGWRDLETGLHRLETQKRGAEKRATAAFRARGDAMANRLAAGADVSQAELAQMALDSSATPGGKALMQETVAKISAARAIRDMSLKQGQAHVDGLKKQYGAAPTEAEARTLAFAQKTLADKRKAISTDSVSYAEAQGIVPATPFLTDAESPGDLMSTMAARAEGADEAAIALGTSPRYLKAGEAKGLSDRIKADPKQGSVIAASIVHGAGTRAPAVLAEFGQDAPMIAESGSIIAFGGSARAAEDVILGYGKGADGKQLKGIKPDAARENFGTVTGGALALAERDSSRIASAAAAITRRRITDEGLDPASDEALAIHGRAVQEAAGAVFDRGVQFGGFADFDRPGLFSGSAKVLVPSAIRADSFGELVAAISDDDLNALPVKPKAGDGFFAPARGAGIRQPKGLAATLRDAVPIAVDGGFAFALGDPAGDDPQFIMGDDGNAFVLDIMALKDRLAPRVPGAFR